VKQKQPWREMFASRRCTARVLALHSWRRSTPLHSHPAIHARLGGVSIPHAAVHHPVCFGRAGWWLQMQMSVPPSPLSLSLSRRHRQSRNSGRADEQTARHAAARRWSARGKERGGCGEAVRLGRNATTGTIGCAYRSLTVLSMASLHG
jgi:hypothetical protein